MMSHIASRYQLDRIEVLSVATVYDGECRGYVRRMLQRPPNKPLRWPSSLRQARERERERDTELAELEGALPLRLDALLRRTVELLVNHSRPCFVLLKCTEPAPWTARSRALISLFCPSFLASSAAAVLNNDEMLSARVSFILVSFLTCGRNTSPR